MSVNLRFGIDTLDGGIAMPTASARFWSVIGFTLISLGLSSFASNPASAASCRGSSCNGKSPITMGCVADAVNINQVVDQDNASGGTFGRQVVTLRYSRKCNASWARVTASAGGTARVTSSVAYMGGYKPSTKRTRNGPGSTYSNMRAGSAISSCGKSSFNNGAVVKTHCATAG
jgi:Protein of unknown function (DUF2690)